MKIGIIGAENSHSEHFCRSFNEQDQFPGSRIEYLYGADDPEKAACLSEKYGLTLCDSEEELTEKSDAVVITYRRGSEHFSPAMKVMKAGKPLFNDKPFAVTNAEAKELADYAAENGSLVCGGSNLKDLPELEEMKSKMGSRKTAVISFGGDVSSPYDGYWFYGIHSAELCICLCGEDYVSVDSYKNGDSVISLVKYSDRSCVIVTNPRNADLHITITGEDGFCHKYLPLNYQSVGPAEFMDMIESGKLPRPLSHYVAATRLVNDIIASFEKEKER